MFKSYVIRRLQHSIRIKMKKLLLSASTRELADGLISGRRDSLAKAITLIESTRKDHRTEAELLIDYLSSIKKQHTGYNKTGITLRLGVAGPPGAGKSTFIEALGMRFINQSYRVAVIPVDPSSHISGGSILGDKTRMENLSKSDNAYVRASPTRGVLGGIAEHTSDVVSLCEAASYSVVIIESVGLGQSEVDIDNAVDMLLVVVPPGGGDGLQASKKGIMEAADLVVVNKADGSLLESAQHTKGDYSGAMQFIRQKCHDWRAKVLLMSCKTGYGIDDVEDSIKSFHSIMTGNNQIIEKRRSQYAHWMWGHIKRNIIGDLQSNQQVMQCANMLSQSLVSGDNSPRSAASKVTSMYLKDRKSQ